MQVVSRTVAAVLLAVTVGCGGGDSDSEPPETKTANEHGRRSAPKPAAAPAKPDPPEYEAWPEPAAVLVFSGQQLGHLEPCGCAPETLAGGLGRRHDLVEQLKAKGWPVTALELGDTLGRSRRQSEIKFETTLAAYETMGYSAVGMGPGELNLGAAMLLALHTPAGPDAEPPLAFVSANADFYGEPTLPGGPLPLKVVEIGGLKIAVTSVVVENPREPRLSESATKDVSIRDAKAALEKVTAAEAFESADLRVLLANATEETTRSLLQAFPGFEVATSHGPEEPKAQPDTVGDTLLFSVGRKGKYVGVLGVFPDAESELRYELVHLDKHRFTETKAMHELKRDYQDRLERERLAAHVAVTPHPMGTTYVGAAKCGECHTKAYDKWKTTGHARAYDSLEFGYAVSEDADHDVHYDHPWISRVHDPECLSCHVTGWDPQEVVRYEGGFVNPEFTESATEKALAESLKGQQCENCHGPGRRHTELEEMWQRDTSSVDDEALRKAREEVRLLVVKDPVTQKPLRAVRNSEEKVGFCYRCHDQDNSPNFDFPSYWEKVNHTFGSRD